MVNMTNALLNESANGSPRARRNPLLGVAIVYAALTTDVLIETRDNLRSIIERAKNVAPQIPGKYLIRTRRGKPYSGRGFSAIWQRLMLSIGFLRS
jgi:hypothetical protein